MKFTDIIRERLAGEEVIHIRGVSFYAHFLEECLRDVDSLLVSVKTEDRKMTALECLAVQALMDAAGVTEEELFRE